MIYKKYKNIYDKFIEHYKNVHVNPWHEINEEELKIIETDLINKMDIEDEYTFKYFVDFIIKKLSGKSDAHTRYEAVSPIPANFRIYDNEVFVNFPDTLKYSKLQSINGIDINCIIEELEDVITYGTKGKRKYELEKSLFNRYILFGLPSLRGSNGLCFEVQKKDETIEKIIFNKNEDYSEEMFDYKKYRYGNPGEYRFEENCLIYTHSSVQINFKEKIELSIQKLKFEDLSNIDTIIIDIRGNTGGHAGLNKILMDYLKDCIDKKLICLTDYRVFSGGRYALRDLINLGATTIGEEIGTPINCYGNSDWINVENHYFSSSSCYFSPFVGWSASSKEEFKNEVTEELLIPYIFKPDILTVQNKDDYMKGFDSILEYAIGYNKTKRR